MSDVIERLAAALEQQTAILAAMQANNGEANKQMHTKTPANTWTATGTFQPGGIFSIPGTDRDVFTAMITSVGLGARLPKRPSLDTNPRFATITGFTATTGDRPSYPCSDSPAGFMKGCYLTARFGRTSFDTQTIEWDKVKIRANRGTFDDLILHGSIFGDTGLRPQNMTDAQLLNVVTLSEMAGAVVHMERDLERQLWQGVMTQFTANGGFQEFPGLDVQIATGQVDADTNTTCPALDSDVKDFNYNLVSGTTPSIVTYMSMLEWYIYHNASRMGLLPASWVWCMTPGMWQELTAIWPCQYNTNRCANSIIGAASSVTVMGNEMVAERDAMRKGMTIEVNGRTYPVIVDDGIFEHNSTNNANLNPGDYASSIYFVPLTAAGGFPVTYLEHVDYRAGGDDIAALRGNNTFWTDDGIFSWALEQTKWCYKLSLKTEMRVVLRTPQLAGRIDHVRYSPLQHLRDELPSSPYWVDGGVSLRGQGTSYAVWLSGRQ